MPATGPARNDASGIGRTKSPACSGDSPQQHRQRRVRPGDFLDGQRHAYQPDQDQQRSDRIKGMVSMTLAPGHKGGRQGKRRQHHRQVDQEHRAPMEMFQQRAADHRAKRRAARCDGGPDANGKGAVVRILECVADD